MTGSVINGGSFELLSGGERIGPWRVTVTDSEMLEYSDKPCKCGNTLTADVLAEHRYDQSARPRSCGGGAR